MDYELRKAEETAKKLSEEESKLRISMDNIHEKEASEGKLSDMEQQRLLHLQQEYMENIEKQYINHQSERLAKANISYEEGSKGPIARINHTKELKEIKENTEKGKEVIDAVNDLKKNPLLQSNRADNYRKIENAYGASHELNEFVKTIEEAGKNEVDNYRSENQQIVFQQIIKDKDFAKLLQDAKDIENQYTDVISEKERIDYQRIKNDLSIIQEKGANMDIPSQGFNVSAHKNNIEEYIGKHDLDFNRAQRNRYKGAEQSIKGLYQEQLIENQIEEEKKNGASHRKLTKLEKQQELATKKEVLDKIMNYLNQMSTADKNIAGYDFTKLQEKISSCRKEIMEYSRNISKKLNNEEELENSNNQEYHKFGDDGTVVLSSEQNNLTGGNNELDDMFAEDRLSNLPNGLTIDMITVAADIQKRNGMVATNDPKSLTQEEMNKVVEYAKKIQTFEGMNEHEVAEQMAMDPWIDENGHYHQREEITPVDIMSQENINRMNNVYNRINNAYGFTEDQERTI